jgi:molecular chaperone HscB
VIQPLSPNANYFSYLDLDKKFTVDNTELQKKFHKIQSYVHPDKFGGKGSEEKQYSEQHSSYLNQAYKTLKEPHARAVYLLELLTKSESFILFLIHLFYRTG